VTQEVSVARKALTAIILAVALFAAVVIQLTVVNRLPLPGATAPDLVLLLVAGAYCLTRAVERAGTQWVIAAGTMIGFAFLAKMMQAFLVLPAFALVYMVATPTGLRRRVVQTLAGGLAVVVSAGAFNSPQLLELSGIGQPERLRNLGIRVLHELPGALKPPQRQQRHQVPGMQARRGGIKARVQGHGPALCCCGQRIEVSGLRDQTAPTQLVEDHG